MLRPKSRLLTGPAMSGLGEDPMEQPIEILVISSEPEHRRALVETVAQVLLLVLFPYLDHPGVPTVIFRSLAIMAFVAGVYGQRKTLAVDNGAGPSHSLHRSVHDRHSPTQCALDGSNTTVHSHFSCFHSGFFATCCPSHNESDHDTIYGSLSVYLLMGITWGFVYLLFAVFRPTALLFNAIPGSSHSIDSTGWSDCTFYSFVTLTSLGGRLVPVSPEARSLTIVENVSGVFYVALLIARLISAYSASTAARTLKGLRELETIEHANKV
jgi:hypothetical protein